jgi:SAM-dependent methyltransferase
MRLPGDGDRSGREARIGSRAGWISRLLQDAAAADLPFGNCSFDLAVAYNVLMDVEDVPAVLKEIRRALRARGNTRYLDRASVFRSRRFATAEATSPIVIQDTYFGRKRFEDTEERDGLRMRFAGWSRPLETYATALEDAALAITSPHEPVPSAGDGRSDIQRWTRIPHFLRLKAQPLALKWRDGVYGHFLPSEPTPRSRYENRRGSRSRCSASMLLRADEVIG